jgi:NADH:ubiquinone oxidoreductase subunit H
LQEIVRFLYSEPFIKAAIFPGALFSTVLGIFAVWFERKLFARVSLRVGPLHVGKVSGNTAAHSRRRQVPLEGEDHT